MAKKNNDSGMGSKMAIGASVVGLAGAAYLLFGPEGKKHQKDMKSWMLKMKAEALEKMEDLKELSAPVYENLVSELESKYKAMKNVDSAALAKEVANLKKNYRTMAKEAKMKMMKGKKPAAKAKAKAPAKKKARA